MAPFGYTGWAVLLWGDLVIFVTVGAQMPFDRLIAAVDSWAGMAGRPDVFAQIGQSRLHPEHIESIQMIPPEQFKEHMARAQVIVAHAGTGTILTAMMKGKPILVMPRKASLQETRNDHQFATARRFAERGIAVAWDEDELLEKLDHLDELKAARQPIGASASPELIRAIRHFIETGQTPVCENLSSTTVLSG